MDQLSDTCQKMLIVDDDEVFRQVLARAMRKRNFDIRVAESTEKATESLSSYIPDLAIVDLKMTGANGLKLIPVLKEKNPNINILMLTGYASIATAVEAIRLGASNYLCKPADADQILAALSIKQDLNEQEPAPLKPMSVEQVEWEHIQRVLLENDGNVSETARQLGMHRRTLQRKLARQQENTVNSEG